MPKILQSPRHLVATETKGFDSPRLAQKGRKLVGSDVCRARTSHSEPRPILLETSHQMQALQ
jgi:hypothetical protein